MFGSLDPILCVLTLYTDFEDNLVQSLNYRMTRLTWFPAQSEWVMSIVVCVGCAEVSAHVYARIGGYVFPFLLIYLFVALICN